MFISSKVAAKYLREHEKNKLVKLYTLTIYKILTFKFTKILKLFNNYLI